MASKPSRSSISPFRSRRQTTPPAPVAAPAKSGARASTPSSSSNSRTAAPSSARPSTTPARIPSRMSPELRASTPPSHGASQSGDSVNSRDNVIVTVRFRPLSAREINKGDEVAWYADGDHAVRNEYNPSIVYGFDKVFGPATTTRHVYDVAAQQVVSGAMEGINGTVFAYGVTSSGKTHTMHGEQKSPGIIPLAIKDVFSIIQETPGREFLLRVSYLEIYNEVINDLLDPTGQNLRIREDAQGTYVEGIKEEVVLSPAHALSLIATGEEHRHIGSNNFNLASSRSHTIFTLTIESSPTGENEEDVRLSQLNLIDLAGSESSKAETTGLRRKEGSYINKSLLTLGTVISKLTDSKATHIPYRDSKLTRLLQSSLSGHGQISLICTVTPASSNSEETHNTLKFAHRSKHVEVKAAQNKILDEKSLIKKYQREISCLKQELQQLKLGMLENPYAVTASREDLVNLKLQLEAGKFKLQSRLEEEEEAKAALMGRIQRLTKLILVSTKSTITSNISEKAGYRRRHSFGEDELAYLPDKKREYFVDDDEISLDSEFSTEVRMDATSLDEPIRFDKKNRKKGMLAWFKSKKSEQLLGMSPADSESSAGGSPSCSQTSEQKQFLFDNKDGMRKSISRNIDDPPTTVDPLGERTQAGDLFSGSVKGRRHAPTETTIIDQMDLLREQVKMLAGEIALCTSSLKRISEQATSHPEDSQIQEQMQKLKDEISEKKQQIHFLEQRMIGSFGMAQRSSNDIDTSQILAELITQLNERTFELEIMSADNRVLQEQLQLKTSENTELQENILLLRQQLDSFSAKDNKKDATFIATSSVESGRMLGSPKENSTFIDVTSKSTNLHSVPSEYAKGFDTTEPSLMAQVLMQAVEIENLKQENVRLAEEKEGLEIHSQKLAEEASYAKELAAAAATELRNLAEEVTKLSYQNAKLIDDLTSANEVALGSPNGHRYDHMDSKQYYSTIHADVYSEKPSGVALQENEDMWKELAASHQKEASLESALRESNEREAELNQRIEEGKNREQELENELANMWVLVAKMKKNGIVSGEPISESSCECSKQNDCLQSFNENGLWACSSADARAALEHERRQCKELEGIISRLKGEDLSGLDFGALEELQNFHVEALSKICKEKMTNRVQ